MDTNIWIGDRMVHVVHSEMITAICMFFVIKIIFKLLYNLTTTVLNKENWFKFSPYGRRQYICSHGGLKCSYMMEDQNVWLHQL